MDLKDCLPLIDSLKADNTKVSVKKESESVPILNVADLHFQ